MDDELCGYDRAMRALDCLCRAAGDFKPRTAVVLGSGLGSVADEVEDARILPAAKIPGWPISTAPGHAGRVVMGTLERRRIEQHQAARVYLNLAEQGQRYVSPLHG